MIRIGSIVQNLDRLDIVFRGTDSHCYVETIEAGDQWIFSWMATAEDVDRYIFPYTLTHMSGRQAHMTNEFLSKYFVESEHNDD